ncbi:MAG: hypothetical protein HC917_15760, partial [Richelia sp. SM2_1_7]|nr:hypothetical protein [Richelia sp. SM2_1_7]
MSNRTLDNKFILRCPSHNGDYKVTLKFVELYWDSAAKRSFDLSAEGQLVINDLDILQKQVVKILP